MRTGHEVFPCARPAIVPRPGCVTPRIGGGQIEDCATLASSARCLASSGVRPDEPDEGPMKCEFRAVKEESWQGEAKPQDSSFGKRRPTAWMSCKISKNGQAGEVKRDRCRVSRSSGSHLERSSHRQMSTCSAEQTGVRPAMTYHRDGCGRLCPPIRTRNALVYFSVNWTNSSNKTP